MFTLIIEDRYGAIVDEYSFEDGEFVIGRSQSCDIVLAADNVSRRHARLFTVEGRCYIEDLNAANGVWLNGKRIYNVTELPRSAQVRIGDFFLHIEGAAFSHPMGPTTYARLVPMQGTNGGPFELNRPTTLVGRGKDCAIVIHDASVSRIHTKLTLEAGRVVVEDLRSSNGTWVNDRRIDSIELRHGDRLRFGTVGFHYLVDGQDAEVAGNAPSWSTSSAVVKPSADAVAFRQAPPISSFGSDYPEMYKQSAAAPPAANRSWLPHVAVVAVFVLAATMLVVVVGFAYDRFLGPELPPRPAAAAAVDPAATEAATEKRRFEELLARGRDAIANRQWEQAETIFKDARRIDPIGVEPTRAMNRIATEKRAGQRFLRAEEAFKAKDYGEAIRQHRLIPESSVYRPDASAALKAIAGILEIDGDAECAGGRDDACRARYALALSTEFASAALEKKYAKLLKPEVAPAPIEPAPSKRRRRRSR